MWSHFCMSITQKQATQGVLPTCDRCGNWGLPQNAKLKVEWYNQGWSPSFCLQSPHSFHHPILTSPLTLVKSDSRCGQLERRHEWMLLKMHVPVVMGMRPIFR